jgi:chemotaxis signal transduction protein
VFTVAGRQLAADIRHTREVVALPDRTPVPRAPAHVLGVANLRGYIVPIVDIRHLLGSPAGPPSEAARTPRTIVLEGDGAQSAIAMDEVLGLESFDEVLPGPPAASSTPGAPPVDAANGPVSVPALGLLKRGDAMATLLDVPALVEAVRVRPPSRPDA